MNFRYQINMLNGNISEGGIYLHYLTPDCSGQPYTYWWHGLIADDTGQWYLIDAEGEPRIFSDMLRYKESGNCISTSGTDGRMMMPVNPVTLPFSDPLPLPLTFQYGN